MLYCPGFSFASSTSSPPSRVLDVDRRSSINDVPHVLLNKIAEYSDMPERIRLRQVNSTLRDGVPPTVPPWRCAFTDDDILDDCDVLWSKISEIMVWFLIVTHNRVEEEDGSDPTVISRPAVYFEINKNLPHGFMTDNGHLHQRFWWQKRVYTISPEGLMYGPPEEQWMVENHEDYYQGCRKK